MSGTAAAYHRHDISDRAWDTIAPNLSGGPGKVGRPAQDNRRFINAVFWLLRPGATCPSPTDTGTPPTAASPAGRRRDTGHAC